MKFESHFQTHVEGKFCENQRKKGNGQNIKTTQMRKFSEIDTSTHNFSNLDAYFWLQLRLGLFHLKIYFDHKILSSEKKFQKISSIWLLSKNCSGKHF